RAGGQGGGHAPELPANLGAGAERRRPSARLPAPPRAPVGADGRGDPHGDRAGDEARGGDEPPQPHGPRADGRDAPPDPRALSRSRRLAARRRGVPGRRARRPHDAVLLGRLRADDRRERPLQSVRAAGAADRVDRRAAGVLGRGVGTTRLHYDRARGSERPPRRGRARAPGARAAARPLEAFRDRISFAVAVRAVERGFRALALGEATLPDPMVVELAEQRAEVHVKGAHLRGARHIVLKLATGFYQNRARGLPSGDGMFLLLDAETGAPDLLLEEHGYLTDLRTAAAVALTLKYLAPQDARDA